MKNFRQKLVEFFNVYDQMIYLVLILFMLPLIYVFVYYTGGIKYVYSHTMYIPILLAGILFGPKFGILIALLAGILLGPLMPIDTISNEPQMFINWFYRLLIFTILGFVSGYASQRLKRNAKKIHELMSYNQETKIPNTNFLTRSSHILSKGKQTVFSVLISNSHNIMDALGMDVYHRLLHTIYQDLLEYLPKNSIVIQPDSNKFWIVKPFEDSIKDSEHLIKVINKLKIIDDIPLYIEYSIGTSMIFSGHLASNLSSFSNADTSARFAKLQNLEYVVYNNHSQKIRDELSLLADFSKALHNGETYLAFQPKMDMTTNKPIGLEALMRWQHPIHGLIPPDQFIPLIEETKLIHLLTDWVAEKALEKIAMFHSLGHDIPISINISAKNLFDPLFHARLMSIVDASKINRNLLRLEITESVLMINPKKCEEILNQFVKDGILIALDDYGSGYSSLAYLAKFPISTLKIDRFFMEKLVEDASMHQIVQSTIQLAKNLGYEVIAEGVETQEVVDLLKSYGCVYAQGYFFAKPIHTNEIIDWYLKNI